MFPGSSTAVVPLQGWGYYVETLFSTYHEVHAFELGVFAGLLLLVLLYLGLPRTAGLSFLAITALALGLPSVDQVCWVVSEGCGGHVVQREPWYFLGGMYAAPVIVAAATQIVSRAIDARALSS